MEILTFDPVSLDISMAIISGENCGSPTDSIGEFLLGITTDPVLDPNEFPPCFYDNGWALLVLPVNFVLVDINAPGPWLQSGDTITFNIIDAFLGGSDASVCWQETINNGFFEDYCWILAITQINDSYTFPYESESGIGQFDYPDVTPENNIVTFSPFDPNCNSLEPVDTLSVDTLSFEFNLCSDPSLWLPNTFTPNNDGKNDSFRPVITSPSNCWDFWEFQVYNRWGTKVFESDIPGMPWRGDVTNGSLPFAPYNGTHYVPDGVYIWKLRARHRYGETYELYGHVTLFR
jgi:gliding motility-associated-like protein